MSDEKEIRSQKSEVRGLVFASGVISAIILALLWAMFIKSPPPVNAQGPIGNVNFAQPFSVDMTSSISYVSVKNIGQSAGSVQYNGVSGTECPIYLEASANNVNWWVMASSSPGPLTGLASSGLFYANGFSSYYRLVFNPNSSSTCNNLTVTGSYYGYSQPVPINRHDNWYPVSSIGSPQQVTPTGISFYSADSFQCTNTAASAAAYLQLFSAATTPTLGSGFFYQAGIAAGTTLNVNVPGAVASNTLWAGASTAAGGSTAGGPLVCTFQVNTTGPFYPLLPSGP